MIFSTESAPKDHSQCGPWLKSIFAEDGIEVTVSTARPLIRNQYTTDPFICPHGTPFWPEPTSEQIAAWIRDKVE